MKIGKIKDITGQRFGKITVIKQGDRVTYPSGSSKVNWICECDCGNEVITNGPSLRKGNTTSCGKCRWVDRVGQVFGKLTVISKVPDIRNDFGKIVTTWHCQCECGNTHNVGGHNLVAGNVKSCGCLFDEVQEADLIKRKETFLINAAKIHYNKYEYDLSTFENTNSTIEISCTKHGKFLQAVRDHIFGCGCQKCAAENRSIGLEEFIRRGKEHFGNKYDYSSVEYINNSTKVKLTCPEHGDFEQIAASHMNGSGCFECSANLRHWNYKAYCKRSEEFANTIGKLYLLKLTNKDEKFLKIGVSVGFLNRLAKYRQDGFEIEILKTFDDLAINIAEKESELLRFIKSNHLKYIPLIKFSGRTECAVLEAEDLIKERI